MKTRRTELRKKFLTLARDRVQRIREGIDTWRHAQGEPERLDELLREVHTLKGEGRLVGLDGVSVGVHALEDLLLGIRPLSEGERESLWALADEGVELIEVLVDHADGRIGEAPSVDIYRELVEAALVSPTDAAVRTPRGTRKGVERALQQLARVRDERSIRIPLERLDELTDAAADLRLDYDRTCASVEELAATLQAYRDALEELAGTDRVASARLAALRRSTGGVLTDARDAAFEAGLRMSTLDEEIRRLRLQPLAIILGDYPAAVQALAEEQGKEIELVLEGVEIGLDKEVLDRLGEPLLHLMRNAIDHGIETPEERVADGKQGRATLSIVARQHGSTVTVEVSDDGRGVDAERVARTAVRKGIVPDNHIAGLSDEQMTELIFEAGFSTASRVTEISGRGLGLDVVKERVEALGGSVTVATEVGVGTRFTVTTPTAMVFTPVMVVKAGSGSYAVPVDSVSEIVGPEAIREEAAGTALLHGDARLPIVSLSAMIAEGGAAQSFLVVDSGGQRAAVGVDAVRGERKVVQRSFDSFLSAAHLFSGATVLESGEVTALLDPSHLVRLARQGRRWSPVREAEGEARNKRVVVVDDSEVTRDLVASVLRTQDCDVVEAVNGREGLARIAETLPALVVTDLEMPVLDGFGLLQALRGDPAWRHLPVIVFSTRGAETDRSRAAELGADHYLVKATFREEALIELVRRYVDD